MGKLSYTFHLSFLDFAFSSGKLFLNITRYFCRRDICTISSSLCPSLLCQWDIYKITLSICPNTPFSPLFSIYEADIANGKKFPKLFRNFLHFSTQSDRTYKQTRQMASHRNAIRYKRQFARRISSTSTGRVASPIVGFFTIFPK